MMRPVLGVVFILMLAACSATSSQVNRPVDRPASPKGKDVRHGQKYVEEALAHNTKCFDKWEKLLSEWHTNGGGIKDSLVATREQIASDERSKFAQIVRRIWISQKQEQTSDPLPIGTWPVGDEKLRQATKGPNFTVDNLLPQGCESFAYLDPLLWEEVVVRKDDKLTVRKLRETPADMEWDSYSAPLWISYWLFVRLD